MNFRLCIVAVVATFFVAACASTPKIPRPEHFAGHWTVGPGFSQFKTIDGKQVFYIFGNDMPESASAFLDAQPSHSDTSSSEGFAVSAYFEVIAQRCPSEEYVPQGVAGAERLRVSRVLRMAPARAHFLAERSPRSR